MPYWAGVWTVTVIWFGSLGKERAQNGFMLTWADSTAGIEPTRVLNSDFFLPESIVFIEAGSIVQIIFAEPVSANVNEVSVAGASAALGTSVSAGSLGMVTGSPLY